MEQGAAKMAWFGPQGSGKTMSATQVALGLSLHFHQGAPVAFFDTEKGSDFAKALFDTEGVKMLRVKSRAFADLLTAVKEAEQAGCCALIVDSMSHVWNELMDSFCRKKKIQRPEFHHWREIKGSWRDWTDAMLNSNVHMLICGRSGKEYEYQDTDDNGKQKKELITTGTKFKAEGEFGYEPDVLVEMWLDRKDAKRKGSHLVHKGLVLKDRTWAINGQEFNWEDQAAYKKGDYTKVYERFTPYFNYLTIGGPHHAIACERNSDAMFDANGDSRGYRDARQKTVVLGELKETFTLLWPGSTGEAKKLRILASERVFSCRSWEGIEQKSLPNLEHGLRVLRRFEDLAKAHPPADETEMLAVLDQASAKIADEAFEINEQDTLASGQPVPF